MKIQIKLLLIALTLAIGQFNSSTLAAPAAPPTSKDTPKTTEAVRSKDAPKSKDASKTAGKIDARCEQILQKMAETYRSSISLSAKIKVDMTLQSAKGSKQDLPAQYVISIAKPNRYSVQLVSTRGGSAVSNGKRSEFYFQPAGAYMIAPSLPTLEESFDKHEFRFVTAGLLNFALTRELMETNPYNAIMKDVQRVQYIGTEKVDGVDCDRLRLSQPRKFDIDIWVEKSNPPVLKKVQPDMSEGLSESAKRSGNKILLSFLYKDQVFGKPMNDGRFETIHPADAKFVREFFHEEGGELIGKKAPEVTLPMTDGTKIKLSSLGDRLVILDFWATWCPPCVMSLPVFAKASEDFKTKGVVFIAVNKGEDVNTAKRFFLANKIHVPSALDQDGRIGSAYNVEGIPCTVFIGRDGIVKGVHVGIAAAHLRETFIEDLNKFVNGKSLKREQ
jgi:thiol-disulfide isomerase/thioredoxin